MARYIKILLVLLNLSCTKTVNSKKIIQNFEEGYLSISEIQNIANDSQKEVVKFISFFMDYWYGYNNDKNAVFNNYIEKCDLYNTWYYTACYIHHSQLNDIPSIQIQELLKKANVADKHNENIYLKIYTIFNDLDKGCSSEIIRKRLINEDTGFERYSFYNSLKTSVLIKNGFYSEALHSADNIRYKNMDHIKSFQKALVYYSMGDYLKYEYELNKAIERGHPEYLLEQIFYRITELNDLDIASKMFEKNIFNENVEYLLTRGIYFQALGENENALNLFEQAFKKSNQPEVLYDYLWLALSTQKYDGLEKYFVNPRFEKFDWFNAYYLVYVIEYQMDSEKAKAIFQSFEHCKQDNIAKYLVPFIEVKKVLGLDI